jgi:hypothetical protein
MIAAALLYLGLFALAAAMPRHAPALLGRWQHHSAARHAAALGWGVIALSLVMVLTAPGWPIALVTWIGLATLAAGVVLLGLTYAPALPRAAAVLAVLALPLALLI